MKHLAFLLSVFFVAQTALVGATSISVTNSPVSGAFPVVAGGQAATLVVDAADEEVVTVVANAFAGDVNLVTNVQPTVANAISTAKPVIIGTLGRSSLITQLVQAGKIDGTKLAGKWETFLISVIDNPLSGVQQALVIAGSDPRGTAFGVFELSRMMGVSPWVWFADVLPAPHSEVYVTQGENIFGPPSVKYRGMFINDEDWGMQPWAAKKMDTTIRPNGKGDIGPNTYEKIFEMMLRSKSNYIWPAMHACTKAFWFYKQNPALAKKYQIVLGGSHCEMLLRNNEDEWRNNFVTEYGFSPGEYNWATNRQTLIRYWGDRVKESLNNPAVYTIGMRGVHDSGIEGYNSDAERKVALEDLFSVQRSILQDTLAKPINQIPQVFIPYKEALNVYNIGLNVPDDVTIMWTDDNFGYIRRLSNPAEQLRSGGSGVYFHFSYWGMLNGSQDYLWLGGTSPAHTSFEMSKAYDLNAKEAWIFNVGDLKPLEFEYQFAMDLAWDVERWKPENAANYVLFWANETFGETLGVQIAEIKTEYLRLTAAGRADWIKWNAFSVTEIEQRLAAFAKLVNKVKSVEAQIPDRLKDAYFELIGYPVEAAASMNLKILGARLSFEYASLGQRSNALNIAYDAQKAYQRIKDLTTKYNKEIAGGKWDGMMDYAPRGHSFFYAPEVADEDNINEGDITPAQRDSVRNFEVTTYAVKNNNGKNIITILWLGIGEASLTVHPLDLTSYTDGNITTAPYVEYSLPVMKGENNILVKCFPTYPIYEGKGIRYAISIDGQTPTFVTVTHSDTDIRRSYALGQKFYQSDANKNVTVRIYFAEPGLVLSGLSVVYPSSMGLLVNPDFEITTGMTQSGNAYRGDPYGWTRTGVLNGNSYGVNSDAANYHGQYVCWYSSTPMPPNFELSQTINNLPPGEYILRCKLGVPTSGGGLTTQRMFAGNNVQYYGKASDYGSNLTAGENNTFAGYEIDPGDGGGINLKEMYLKFFVDKATDLKIGIRTSNKKKDGSAIGSYGGWFKVDYFRLEQVTDFSVQSPENRLQALIEEAQAFYNSTIEGIYNGTYPAASRAAFATAIQSAIAVKGKAGVTVQKLIQAISALETAIAEYSKSVIKANSLIVNPDFEDTQGLRQDGTNFRGDPYGWTRTGALNGQSWGINADALNYHGKYLCWYQSTPMPPAFELYQDLHNIPAGHYVVKCRLAVKENRILSTQRLFAGNNVQYFGKEADYDENLTAGENNTFADWAPDGTLLLKEMRVEADVAEDGNLRIGIRSGNQYKDGSAATNEAGTFKVDYFRLEQKEVSLPPTGVKNEKAPERFSIENAKGGFFVHAVDGQASGTVQVYSITGIQVVAQKLTGNRTFVSLPAGVYIVRIASGNGEDKTIKVIVR